MSDRERLRQQAHLRQSAFSAYGGDFYEGKGVMMRGSPTPGNPSGVGGGKRGTIKGWSSASRRRMRAFLLTHDAPGCVMVGASFTIPGPVMEPKEAQALFAGWANRAVKARWGAVWRLEVQARGALHWHLLVAVPLASLPALVQTGGRVVVQEWAALQVKRAWEAVLVVAGPVSEGDCTFSSRMAWKGADLHAAHAVSGGAECGAWLRYLQDHATKAKQEQIAENVGRHWGVVGRKAFVQVLPDEVVNLNAKAYAKVLRVVRRLVRPSVRDPRAPFGRRLGYENRRGGVGRSVWFSRPETFRRVFTWADEETGKLRVEGCDDGDTLRSAMD